MGGSISAKRAQAMFRRKKQPFALTVNLICVLHIMLAGLFVLWRIGILSVPYIST